MNCECDFCLDNAFEVDFDMFWIEVEMLGLIGDLEAEEQHEQPFAESMAAFGVEPAMRRSRA